MPERSSAFRLAVAAAVLVGAVVRLAYFLADDRAIITGDGFAYHLEALRLADGLGYTSPFPESLGAELAHHPPGWTTVLAAVSRLGGRTLVAHQVATYSIGLVLVALAALVGRRWFDARTGWIAAVITALYPGFWVLEAQVLAEPLGLVVLAVLLLCVASLRERPSIALGACAGATCGLLTLVRTEQIAMLVLLMFPLVFGRAGTVAKRAGVALSATVACFAVVFPWVAFNSSRFTAPVLISTNGGSTLLAGNCPPGTYYGDYTGYFDLGCIFRLTRRHPELDIAERSALTFRIAQRHMAEHRSELPRVMLARVGRMLAAYRTSQTVELTAKWMKSAAWPVWIWVWSYWLLLALAAGGTFLAMRGGRAVFPFLIPLALSFVLVVVFYGEPRYHTLSDLGVIVLASVLLERLLPRRVAVRPS